MWAQSNIMIHIRAPIDRSAPDTFSPLTAEMLQTKGLPSKWALLWPKSIYRTFHSGRIPFGRTIFRNFLADPLARLALRQAQKGDIAWIIAFCVPFSPTANAEESLVSRGVKYVFQVVDDWFDIPNLREGTLQRCRLANLIGVPTPFLAKRVLEFFPEKKVIVFEEPIQTSRFNKIYGKRDEKPTVLWNGNPYNLEHIAMVLGVLRRVNRITPFRFRFICTTPPPSDFSQGLDLEYQKYDPVREAQQISGSWLGLAPMPDTGHNRCKGAYKVKTYLAAGLPVIASPVGFQKQLITDGRGVGFFPETTTDWERALLSLLQNPDLSLRMGERAKLYAAQRFSFAAVADSWASQLKNSLLLEGHIS